MLSFSLMKFIFVNVYIHPCGRFHEFIFILVVWFIVSSISSICEFCLCGHFLRKSNLSVLLKFFHGNIFTHTNNCNCVIDFVHKCIEFSSRDRFLLMWFYHSMDNFIFMVNFWSISSINNVSII